MRVRLPPLTILVLLVLVLLASIVEAEELYSSSWDRGVLVVLYGSQYGTGWFVSRNYVVTAGHVVNYNTHTRVTLIKGDWCSTGIVVYADSLHDIAVIRVERPPAEIFVFSLAARDPEKGQRIFVLGYPFELYKIVGDLSRMSVNPRVSMGVVAWVDSERRIFEISAAVDAGNSGGPVVDNYGNVVGIVSFALKGKAATLYYATSVSGIREVLFKLGIPFKIGLSSVLRGSTTVYDRIMVAVACSVASTIVSTLILLSLKSRRG